MKTLLLDNTSWDLVLDAGGNIALADNPYAIAQDVASAVRTFSGECWYNTSLGLPYWDKILGKYPPLPFVASKITEAALQINEVAQANTVFTEFKDRKLTGQVQIIDVNGVSNGVTF
jgi:hypothetical protein